MARPPAITETGASSPARWILAAAALLATAVAPGAASTGQRNGLIVFASDRSADRGGELYAAGAASTAQNGLIAFVDNRAVDQGGEIYAVAARGGQSRDISKSRSPDSDPLVSPDGRRLAFFSIRGGRTALYTVGTDGTGLRRAAVLGNIEELEVGVGDFAWSPDAKSIAFTRGESVFAVAARGGKPRRLGAGSFPSWSADGRRLALVVLSGHEGKPNHVVVIRRDGRRLWSRLGSNAQWSPRGGRLAFTTPPSRSRPIRTVVTGPRGHRLAVFAGQFLAWSPNGERVAFYRGSRYTLYVARWSGRKARALANEPSGFAWSPDSRRIAFGAKRRRRAGVWVAGAGGGSPRRIAPSGPFGGYVAVAGWTGRSILLAGNYPVNDSSPLDLYVVRPDGSRLHRVAHAPAGSVLSSAALARGGRTVLYRSENRSGDELFTVRPDGRQVRQLTRDGRGKQSPGWSPDGTEIAYAANDVVGRCHGCGSAIVVREATSGKAHLVGGSEARNPTWAPDGSRIAYEDDDTIVVARADGSSKVSLGSGWQPSWSPDGAHLAFAAAPDSALAAMDANGSHVRRVLPGPASYPAWSPDGSWIAYVGSGGAIRAVHPDGTADHLVLAHTGVPGRLAWSPDGEWIAYSGINVVRADGSQKHHVTEGRSPSWQRLPG